MAKILRKLTIKEMIGNKIEILKYAETGRVRTKDAEGKEILSDVGSVVPLLSVIGNVTHIKAGEGDNGEYVKLFGQFEGTNLQTGEVVEKDIAILPNFIASGIANAIKSAGEGASVQFGVQIGVRFNATAATGYTYEAESMMPAQESDAIKAIKAQMTAAGVTLPAPVKVPQLAAPAPTTAPAAAPVMATKPAPSVRRK